MRVNSLSSTGGTHCVHPGVNSGCPVRVNSICSTGGTHCVHPGVNSGVL